MLKQTLFYLKTDVKNLQKSDIKKLAKVLGYHSDLYYNQEAPVISDSEYDSLLNKLEQLEDTFSIEKKFSEKVGDTIIGSSFEKVAHTRPMISLGNTYNSEDLQDFDTRVKKNLGDMQLSSLEYCLEYKFDGLGIELIYRNGKYSQAITRGDGIEGEDVTENVRGIENIPKTILYTDYLEVRGEIVLPISVFEKLNEDAKEAGTKIFSNPRNAASGSIRMKDASVTKKRKLQFFAYDIGDINTPLPSPPLKGEGKTYYALISSLEYIGFAISSYFEKFQNIEEVIYEIENFGNYKSKIDFEVDGLVLKVNDVSLWTKIGFTEHHPKYAIAYKFPAEIFTTTILSVDHQVGRTGTITPAANLEPVLIGGATIRRATLHNYDEVHKLSVKIGDRVFIKRAGEVIPKIISVAQSAEAGEAIHPPKTCPSCGTPIEKDGEKVRFFCTNSLSCPKQISEQLIFAVGKGGFNIDGLGSKQIEIFLEQGIISDLASIFHLEEQSSNILALEGFKEKSVENLIAGIEKVKKTTIDIVIRSLGIDGVGKKTAKNLSVLFRSPDDLLHFSHTLEELEALPDIGPEVAKNVVEYFSSPSKKLLLRKLADVLEISYYRNSQATTQTFFSGKTVCITGSFEKDGSKISRDTLVEQLERAGGIFTSSVSKKTDYLLAGEKAGSKLKKATEFGVEILDLEKFYDKIL